MTSTLNLTCGALRCELKPALGGCIAGLWHGAQPVLRSTAAELHDVRVAASYPLVPYSNRIGQRQLHWAGQTYALPLNFTPEPHTIHGVGWERAWTVVSASATQAKLAYQHPGDAAWPFAFDAEQTFRLDADTLTLTMTITNRSNAPAPVGLGWHPYFAKSAQTQIQFDAQGRWDMGDDKLPTERLSHSGLDGHCQGLAIDHCFDGWDGALRLVEAGLRMRLSSDLGYLVVFTTPERDSIAIEPVSHVNNALALAVQQGVPPTQLGVRVLQPGERFAAQMRIQVERVA